MARAAARRLRTADPIEPAVQQEIKRRTVKVRVFPSRDALLRLVRAVLAEIDDDWLATDRRYITWGDRDARAGPLRISRQQVA